MLHPVPQNSWGFWSPFNFFCFVCVFFFLFPSNYSVVALPVLFKGHQTCPVPLPCVSKLLSVLLFMCFQAIKTVSLLFAFVIKAAFMQQPHAGCALSLPATIASSCDAAALGGHFFSSKWLFLFSLLCCWLFSALTAGEGEIVKGFYKREGKMIKWTLFVP